MMRWQYAQLTVLHSEERIETRGLIFKKDSMVHDWVVQWFGPDDAQWAREMSSTGLAPVAILNECGQAGWEVVAAFQHGGRFEYVLKRPVA